MKAQATPRSRAKASSPEPNRKASRGEFVRNQVRQAIEQGKFKPGDRMRETDVADWLKVSRTPVREALRLLEAEGLLTFVPWRGVIVAELDRQQIVELYKVRAALEGLAAGLAARHISDAELEMLEVLLNKCEHCKDQAEIASLNRRFHAGVHAASHNRYLTQQLNVLRSALALLKGTTYSVPGRPAAANDEHRAILAALRARDESGAEAAARRHMHNAEVARLTMLSELA
jgi:DNA-binding GntR family transcriptional regulator